MPATYKQVYLQRYHVTTTVEIFIKKLKQCFANPVFREEQTGTLRMSERRLAGVQQCSRQLRLANMSSAA